MRDRNCSLGETLLRNTKKTEVKQNKKLSIEYVWSLRLQRVVSAVVCREAIPGQGHTSVSVFYVPPYTNRKEMVRPPPYTYICCHSNRSENAVPRLRAFARKERRKEGARGGLTRARVKQYQ